MAPGDQNAVLAWNPVTSADLTGYHAYRATSRHAAV